MKKKTNKNSKGDKVLDLTKELENDDTDESVATNSYNIPPCTVHTRLNAADASISTAIEDTDGNTGLNGVDTSLPYGMMDGNTGLNAANETTILCQPCDTDISNTETV